MNDTALYFNENLRSISAIVAARNKQEKLKKLSILSEYRERSMISKQSVRVRKIHRPSSPSNYNPKKASLQRNNLGITKAKTRRWKSSKVVPYNNNVFHFDNGSDLTMVDVLFDRHISTKENHRNMKKMKAKKRCICIAIIICLLAILIIGIIITIVLAVFLIPPKAN